MSHARFLIAIGPLGMAFAQPAWTQECKGRSVSEWITQLQDAHPGARFTAADTLEGCGPAAEEAAGELTELLKDEEERVRIASAKALIRINPSGDNREAVRTLIEIVENSRSGPPVQHAIDALGLAGCKARDAVPVLEEKAQHWAGSIANAAKRALGAIQAGGC